MAFCTGRCMCHAGAAIAFEEEDVVAMLRKVFAGRVQFHDGAEEIAPGLSVHHVGGHSKGLQVVRVWTRRGWMVLAADASHFYANMEAGPGVPNHCTTSKRRWRAMTTLRRLASRPENIIPGHDPLVLARYPAAATGLEGVVVRLDADPSSG